MLGSAKVSKSYDTNVLRQVVVHTARDGGNWFVYCYDNPINHVDITGNNPIEDLLKAFIGAIGKQALEWIMALVKAGRTKAAAYWLKRRGSLEIESGVAAGASAGAEQAVADMLPDDFIAGPIEIEVSKNGKTAVARITEGATMRQLGELIEMLGEEVD